MNAPAKGSNRQPTIVRFGGLYGQGSSRSAAFTNIEDQVLSLALLGERLASELTVVQTDGEVGLLWPIPGAYAFTVISRASNVAAKLSATTIQGGDYATALAALALHMAQRDVSSAREWGQDGHPLLTGIPAAQAEFKSWLAWQRAKREEVAHDAARP